MQGTDASNSERVEDVLPHSFLVVLAGLSLIAVCVKKLSLMLIRVGAWQLESRMPRSKSLRYILALLLQSSLFFIVMYCMTNLDLSFTYTQFSDVLRVPSSIRTGGGGSRRGVDDGRSVVQRLNSIEQLVLENQRRTQWAFDWEEERVPEGVAQYRGKWKTLKRNVPKEEAIEWKPRKGKYLLALCSYGRMSNKRKCFRNYFLAAAIMKRTLVIPNWSERLGKDDFYRFELVMNVTFARGCLGGYMVVSEAEYRWDIGVSEDAALVVDRYLCVRDGEDHCLESTAIEEAFHKLKLKMPIKEQMNEAGRLGLSVYASYLSQLSGDERLVTLGDLYGMSFRGEKDCFPNTPYGHFSTPCHMLMRPHNAIIQAVRGFVETFISEPYMAVHLRRGDFFGNRLGKEDAYYGLLEVARCIVEGMPRGSKIRTVFLATDATEFEVNLLRERLASSSGGRPLSLITFPLLAGRTHDWQWSHEWNKMNLDLDLPLAVPTAQKLVSALSTVFRGSSVSTFTEDIFMIRVVLGLDSHLDSDICFYHKHHDIPEIN